MDAGKVTMMQSTHMKSSIALVDSVRKQRHVLKFYHARGDQYRCYRCEELGKDRTVTIVVDGIIVGRKNPEDGHHPLCQPIPEAVVNVQQLDRDMRDNVTETGKRPREA